MSKRRYWVAPIHNGSGDIESITLESKGFPDVVIIWDDIGPRLEMYDDNWRAFTLIPEFFEWLAENANQEVTLEEVIERLEEMGFENKFDLFEEGM